MRRLGYSSVGDFALLDVSRAARKGVPEVVYAEGKSTEQLLGIVARFLDHSPLVLCSRVSVEQAAELDGMMREMGVDPPKFLQQFFGDPDIRKLAAANVAPAKNMLLSKKAAKR